MKEFNEEYIERLHDLISQQDEQRAKDMLADLHPADIAEIVSDLDTDDALFLLKQLSDEQGPAARPARPDDQ